jgi:hypothetical protein
MRSHSAGMTKIGFDPRPLDDVGTDAVQRILDALGSELTSATLDKGDLAAELAWLVAVFRGGVVHADRGLAKDREARMTNIRNAARQIILALNNDVWSLISRIRKTKESSHRAYPTRYQTNPYKEKLDATMDRLVEDIGHWFDPSAAPYFLHVPSPPGSTWGARRSRSPFDDLVGELAKLFRKQFNLKATFHRRASDNKPDSPFIRFVEQVLSEFRITHLRRPYSRESIAKALTDARTGRARNTRRSTK